MKLRDLDIKPLYNSITEDVISSFYRPTLSCCTEYRRASAYFDANILSLYASGIEQIVEKHGHISFVFSDDIPEKDFDEMKQGYENRAKLENQLVIKATTDSPSPELQNLAYLIQVGVVDIKIAFTSSGIFHDKFGLIYDGDDVLCFRGSNNETAASALCNFESFDTTCSWNASDREMAKIDGAEEEFRKLWANEYPRTIVVDIPDVVKKKVVSYSKGHLLLNYKFKDDFVTLTLDENRHLIALNGLKDRDRYSPKSKFFANHLALYISSAVDNIYHFKDNLPISKMESVVSLTEQMGEGLHFGVYVDPRLTDFINSYHLDLEKYRNLGIAIKKHSPALSDEFAHFKDTVNALLARPLKDPQAWGAFHIVAMKRSANFSVPGAGKTATVLGAYAYLKSLDLLNRIVVIGPLNCFRSWKNEFALCFGNKEELRVFDYQEQCAADAAERYDSLAYRAKKCNLVLINYEALPTNAEAIKTLIDEKTLLVFDEVHRIKGIEGVRGSVAKDICASSLAKYRVVLTGTPIPNGYLDIYNFLHLLYPDQYDGFFGFDPHFLSASNGNPENAWKINNQIYPFFCVTTKEDLHVPPADPDDFETGYCSAQERDDKLYQIVRERCFGNTLLMYIRLVQASSNPALILKNVNPDMFDSFYDPDEKDDSSGDFSSLYRKESKGFKEQYSAAEQSFISSFGMTDKFYRGIQIIKEKAQAGQHVIAWAVFVDTLYKIQEELSKAGVTSEVINGSVPLYEREAILNDFQNNKFDVLIANPATLAESVSLHQNCHIAVYFEYSFNLVHMLQSKDRIHRLGLPEGQRTHYYYLIMDNPSAEFQCIDLKTLLRLKDKESLQKQALTTDNVTFMQEDIEQEIKDLLK
jgi:hypothetical protein